MLILSGAPALAAAVLVAGCGSSSTRATPGPPPGIVFPTSFALTGAINVSGTFTDTASASTPTSCGAFGRQGILGTYFIPFPARGNRLNGQPFEYQSIVGGYHGPGQYSDVHSIAQITVDDGVFAAAPGSTLSLTARPDGTGAVTFTRFVDVGDGERTLSGRIEWGCRRAG